MWYKKVKENMIQSEVKIKLEGKTMKAEVVDIFEREEKRLCKKCGKVEIKGHGNVKYCKGCGEERNKVFQRGYDKSPKRKEKVRAYRQSSQGKKIGQEYRQKPEVKKRILESGWKRTGIKMPVNGWEEVYKIKEQQNNNCSICGRNEKELKRKLSLDHNHETGELRGFLCDNCNHLLGNAEDSIDILCSAISYIKNCEV